MEGKTHFIIATKGRLQEGRDRHTNKKKKQHAQEECDEQNPLKCFERRGKRKEGAITDTTLCNAAINVVEDDSYK